MRQAKEKKPEVDSFPIEVCAVCMYCHMEKTDYLCWVSEPKVAGYDEEAPVFSRGIPIDPNWPMCHKFRPRMHA